MAIRRAIYEQHLASVEAALVEFGWGMRVEQALAKKLGLTTRAIRDLKQKVEAHLAATMDRQSAQEARASFITRLHGHQTLARAREKLGPLSAMLSLEARIIGLDREHAPIPLTAEPFDRDSLIRELAAELSPSEVAAIAEAKGSTKPKVE